MEYTSTQITESLLAQCGTNYELIEQKKQEIFDKSRYLIAQKPADDKCMDTKPGYYKGRKVLHTYNADPIFGMRLNVRDIRLLERKYFIRFVDNATTEGADDSIRMALFTRMSDADADDYERIIAKMKGIKLNERKSQRISGKATE